MKYGQRNMSKLKLGYKRHQKQFPALILVIISVALAYIIYSKLFVLQQNNMIVSINCNGTPKIPDFHNLNEKWQPVEDSNETDYVYSAYQYQVESVETIRIIGVIYQQAKRKNIYCQLWYTGSPRPSSVITSATVEVLQENEDLRYRTSLFRCNLPDVNVPIAVSLTPQPCEVSHNLLPIRSSGPVAENSNQRKFAVCVPPLHEKYNLTRDLIQWIELNRILGADYFVFYNFSSTRQIDFILQFYEKKGLVKVVDWNITDLIREPKKAMHYNGQHAAMNDCLMRMKSISEFSVNCDLDEVLIPHSTCTTWYDITEQIPNHGGYMFLNSFFLLTWENTGIDFPRKHIAEKYNIWPLLKLRRDIKVFNPTVRSKYFSRTKLTEIVGTHEIFKMKGGHHVHTVPSELGLLHHYRAVKVDDASVNATVDDTVYVKYRDKLIDNVIQIHLEISGASSD